MFANHDLSNVDRATAGWGGTLPDWVRLLAEACDRTSQSIVGEQLGRNGPLVSKVLRRVYPGRYDEVEKLVRARLGAEIVTCPIWNEQIPLRSCMRIRRRDVAQTAEHRLYAATCPTCPNNTDRQED